MGPPLPFPLPTSASRPMKLQEPVCSFCAETSDPHPELFLGKMGQGWREASLLWFDPWWMPSGK